MKKFVIIVALLASAFFAVGQNIEHGVSIEAGFSMIDEAKGPCLGARYLMGLNPYLNLTASLAASNGFFYDESVNHHHHSACFYTAGVGIGGQLAFLKRCTARLLAEGGASMFARENYMYVQPSASGTVEVSVRLKHGLELGAFVRKTWMISGNLIPASVVDIGIAVKFQIK